MTSCDLVTSEKERPAMWLNLKNAPKYALAAQIGQYTFITRGSKQMPTLFSRPLPIIDFSYLKNRYIQFCQRSDVSSRDAPLMDIRISLKHLIVCEDWKKQFPDVNGNVELAL